MPRLLLLCLLLGFSPVLLVADEPTDEPDFQTEVLPLLSSRCFNCHGPDEESREAGLRLDLSEFATKELESGETAVVPRDPDASSLLERVTSDLDFLRMPPPESGKALTPDEVDILRRWIASGAEYRAHWAYEPPTAPDVPVVTGANWGSGPLDQFVLKRLTAAKLAPNPRASREVLARRVALALTGLPPSPEQVDTFLADEHPGAYERYVDRLLAAPGFGERWGRVWLDLARYADSAGYAQDPERTIWLYRDWVIDALNVNKPYDEFSTEQLAGDLLPGATHEQRIATAFHRNTMTNSEGGTDDEEFRTAAVVDRVNTTMQVWMGLTMGCAQCHTHKYDPITQADYFRFYAIFNNTADADRGNEFPVLNTLTAEQQQQRERLTAEIAKLEAERKATPPQPSDLEPSTEIKPRFVRVLLPGKSRILHLAEVEVFSGTTNVARSGVARQSSTDYSAPAPRAIDGNTSGVFEENSVTHNKTEDDPWWEVDLKSEQSVDSVVVWNRTGGSLAPRLSGAELVLLSADRKPLFVAPLNPVPDPQITIDVPKKIGDLTAEQQKRRAAYLDPESDTLADRIATLKKQLANIKGVPTPVMEELAEGQRRTTHIQIRGSFLDKGDVVTAGFPESFPPLEGVERPSRLDAAKWLFAEENPLTARVTVNRFWEQLFGVGLVETSEDFGLQGELPTHPQLLDHLATELVRSGWDIKRLLRTIVTSETYKQSSTLTEQKLKRDPRNKLLSRGPRFRLPAEMLRDQSLAQAGLLSRRIGGPSVRPPRPNLGLRAAFGGSTDWKASPGEDRYRRGLYTSWRRTTPYPSMATFDAPSREVCTIRRIRTNTPLQALVMLNDEAFIETAQALARRVIAESDEDTASRTGRLFKIVLSREPTPEEVAIVERLVERLHSRYQADQKAAVDIATLPLGPAPAGMDVTDLAVWTVVANVMGNLDETVVPK